MFEYKKRDIQSRENEANRIAREYKTGRVDPIRGNIFHLKS